MIPPATASISRRDRRTLVAGVGIIVALTALSRGLPALRHWSAERGARDAELRQRVAFVRDAQRQIGPMRDSLRVRRDRLAQLNARLIGAATPNAAVAMLAALVEQLAHDARIKVSALELRGDTSSRNAVARVGVRLSAEGDVFGFAAFMSAVELQREPMTVRTLSVTTSDPLSGDDKSEVLRFDVTIEGLALITTASVR
jgi:type II secretion system (T2SS) protein M